MNIKNKVSTARFTLLELMITMSIVSLIAGMALLGYDQVSTDADEQVIKIELVKIAEALKEFKRNNGHFPDMGDQTFETGAIIYRSHQYHSHNFATLFNVKNLNYIDGTDPEEEKFILTKLPFDEASAPTEFPSPERYKEGNFKYKANWCGPYLGKGRDIKVDFDNDGEPDLRPEYDPLREYDNPGEQYIHMLLLHDPPNLDSESYKAGLVRYAYRFDVESKILSIKTRTGEFSINLNKDEVEVE